MIRFIKSGAALSVVMLVLGGCSPSKEDIQNMIPHDLNITVHVDGNATGVSGTIDQNGNGVVVVPAPTPSPTPASTPTPEPTPTPAPAPAPESGDVVLLHGGKPDKSGAGEYYKWDDAEAIRGLVFDVHHDCTLKSVKVYNQTGEESDRIFTLYDAQGKVVDTKSAHLKAGEQRVSLNFALSKGKGYRLMADIHKGLYKNDEVSYPYEIKNIISITGSDIDRKHYYFFYDWEVEADKSIVAEPASTSEVQPVDTGEVYVPKLDFSKQDVYGNGKVIKVGTTAELRDAVRNAKPQTTIILKDGTYDDSIQIVFPKGKHDLTIKAEHKGKAVYVPSGWDDGSGITFLRANSKNEEIHHINFIDIDVDGKNDRRRQFIKSEGGGSYSVHHIYFKGLNIHNLSMGLYSGLHSHDWTIDHCELHNFNLSHMWYMMGWHHTVQNSKIYNGVYDALVVRGYYPDGQKHTYIDSGSECRGNIYVLERGNRSPENGFLPSKEWTHKIINNQFNSWDLQHLMPRGDKNKNEGYHIGIAYGLYGGDAPCGAEKTYLPPQNITIAGNTFDNRDDARGLTLNVISVNAWQGINNNSLASINGIHVHNNTFFKKHENERFIVGSSTGNYPEPDIDSISTKNNTIQDEAGVDAGSDNEMTREVTTLSDGIQYFKLSNSTLLKSDNGTEADIEKLWGNIECAEDSRFKLIHGDADTHKNTKGLLPKDDSYISLTVKNDDHAISSGDDIYRDNSSVRCELGVNNTKNTFQLYKEGDHIVTFFSIKLGKNFPIDTAQWQSILQMKQTYYMGSTNFDGTPMLSLHVEDGKWKFFKSNSAGKGGSTEELWSTNAKRDVWTRFAFDIVYSTDPEKGSVKIYADLNNDGDALDDGEQSETLHISTLKHETDGVKKGNSIPSHLRIGPYHSSEIDCGDGCVVYYDTIETVRLP